MLQQQDPHTGETVQKFISMDEAKQSIGKYYRTGWKSEKYKKHFVLQIKDVSGPFPGARYFLECVLVHNGREQQINLDYPLIPISDAEQVLLVDALRQSEVVKVIPKQTSTLGSSPQDKETTQQSIEKEMLTMTTETKEVKKKEPTTYTVVKAALLSGKSKEDAAKEAVLVFTDKTIKQVMPIVHSVAAQLKKLKEKAA